MNQIALTNPVPTIGSPNTTHASFLFSQAAGKRMVMPNFDLVHDIIM